MLLYLFIDDTGACGKQGLRIQYSVLETLRPAIFRFLVESRNMTILTLNAQVVLSPRRKQPTVLNFEMSECPIFNFKAAMPKI